jgi:hypothetical protein
MQGRRCHAPGFAGGDIPAGQGQWQQVAHAVEVIGIDIQNFSAPRHTVAAQPDTVERHADHRALNVVMRAMLGQDGGDVRVMVLHADGRYTALMGQP